MIISRWINNKNLVPLKLITNYWLPHVICSYFINIWCLLTSTKLKKELHTSGILPAYGECRNKSNVWHPLSPMCQPAANKKLQQPCHWLYLHHICNTKSYHLHQIPNPPKTNGGLCYIELQFDNHTLKMRRGNIMLKTHYLLMSKLQMVQQVALNLA